MYAYQAPIPPNRHRTVDAPKPESISSIRRRLYQKVTGEKGHRKCENENYEISLALLSFVLITKVTKYAGKK